MKQIYKCSIGIGLATAFLSNAQSVRSEALTFYFSGTIDRVEDADDWLGGAVEVGTPFSGHYTFDPSATAWAFNPTFAQYASTGAEHEFVATVGGITFSRRGTDPFPGVEIAVEDDSPNNGGQDKYTVNAGYDVTASPPLDSIVTSIKSDITLIDQDQTAFNSTDLPLTPPSLAPFNDSDTSPNFNWNQFQVVGRVADSPPLIISGPLERLTLIPEPTSLVLLSIGVLLVGFSVRRGRAARATTA